jgi:HJR/Mrr/RecB family endonuclease
MSSRNDSFEGVVLFLCIICGIGYIIYDSYHLKGLIIVFAIIVFLILIQFIPKKCKHGKRGKCIICKNENKRSLEELQLRLQNELDERNRKFEIQKNIVSNRTKVLDQLKVYNSQSIERMLNQTPYEFEHSVAKIYQDLGYKVKVTPQSNDKGKDIIMFKDGKKYLVECKRYSHENLVNRPDLQKFMAAIYEEKATKGFFVTTSDFTSSAYTYSESEKIKIDLINGKSLMKLYYSVYPHYTEYMKYNMICEVCGCNVEFIYPGSVQSTCKNNHKVFSNIEDLVCMNSLPSNRDIIKENICPKCNYPMEKRWSKTNRHYFWGCTRYPFCTGTLPFKNRR